MSTKINKSRNRSQNDEIINPSCYFHKTSGSSSISGHLYETKLLSLILFRVLHDDNTEDFVLATNLKGVGALDDIVLKYKKKDTQTSKLIFLQAKHRDPSGKKLSVENIMNPNGEFSLLTYLESYYEITQTFLSENDNIMFQDPLNHIECELIMYTTAEQYFTYNKNYKEQLFLEETSAEEAFVKSSGNGKVFKIRDLNNFPEYDTLVLTVTKSRIVMLAKIFSKFILKDNFANMMINDLIKTYHVFLAQRVVRKKTSPTNDKEIDESISISKSHNAYYLAEFQEAFLSSNDENLTLMKRQICEEIAKFKGLTLQQGEEDSIMKLHTFKLPIDFGNNYFLKKQGKLDHLCSLIKKLLENFAQINPEYILIKLDDDSVGPHKIFRRKELIDWLGRLVGNFLIHDDETKMLKFNLDEESLSPDGIKILQQLRNSYELSKIRLDVNIYGFPKLMLSCENNDRQLVRDFLSKLKFYTNQAKEDEVENILKNEIYRFLSIQQKQQEPLMRAKCDVIFLKVHDKIQKWWKELAPVPYLTKECKFYEQARREILDSSLLHITNFICHEKMKKLLIEFNNEAIDSLELEWFLNNDKVNTKFLISDEINFSLLKVIQYFEKVQKSKDYMIIDLECDIIKNSLENVNSELENLELTMLVVVGRGRIHFTDFCNRINFTTNLFNGKVLIIAQNSYKNDLEIAYRENILHKDNTFGLSSTGRKMIFENLDNLEVIFQGELLAGNNILDDRALDLLSLQFLSKIVRNEKIVIGKPWADHFFDKKTDFYVARSLFQGDTILQPNTLKDMEERVVIISAEPGMGKSTLLTQLAMNTKRICPRLWIIKINLLDSDVVGQLRNWKKNKSNINLTKVMTFLYSKIGIKDYENNDIHKKVAKFINISDTYEMTLNADENNLVNVDLSEIRLFNYFYNNNDLAILFDGFDEICPDYANVVIQLISTLKSSRIAHLWVTSRPYNILDKLEAALATVPYNLNPLTMGHQEQYLFNVWYHKMSIGKTKFDKNHSNIVPREIDILLHAHIFCSLIATDFNNDGSFMGIPLHLHMIAEIYQNDFRQYIKFQETKAKSISKNKNAIIEPTSLITVYKRFTNKKFDIQFEEKNTSSSSKDPYSLERKETERKTFFDNHKKISAYLLLAPNIVLSKYEIKDVHNFIKKVNMGKEKTGIVEGKPGAPPKFIHNTFAVYFAAELIFDKLKFSNNSSLWEYFINRILTGFHHEFIIRKFMNSKLQNDGSIITHLKSNEKLRNTVFDILCAQLNKISAIYIAIKENFRYITVFLIECVNMSLNKNNLPNFIKIINRKCDRFCIYCAAVLRDQQPVVKILIKLITDNLSDITSHDSSSLNQLRTFIPDKQICVSLNLLLQCDQPANNLLVEFLSLREGFSQSSSHWTLGRHGYLITFCLDYLSKLNKKQRLKVFSVPELKNQLQTPNDFYNAMNKLLGKEDMKNIFITTDYSSYRYICMLLKAVLVEVYGKSNVDLDDFVTNILPKLQPTPKPLNFFEIAPEFLSQHNNLYKNKLLSIMLLRALIENDIKEFVLVRNSRRMLFDDIILKYKSNDTQKTKLILLQVLYVDNPIKFKLTVEEMFHLGENKDFFLERCLQSYLEIRQSLKAKFQVSIKNVDCKCIVYTNASEKFSKKRMINCPDENNFLRSSKNGKTCQFTLDNKDIDVLVPTVVKSRAIRLARILLSNFSMKSDIVRAYHSFLIERVIHVITIDESHNSPEYCIGKFRQSFLDSKEESLLHLKCELCRIIKSVPTGIPVTNQQDNDASILASCNVKLPIDFCKPLYEKEIDQEQQIDGLCTIFEKIFINCCREDSKHIIIELDDDSVGENDVVQKSDIVGDNSLSRLVGNLLINDDVTEMLKFNLNENALCRENIRILERFKNYDLGKYRFDINVSGFPKLTLNCKSYDRKLVLEFLSKLNFYTNQADIDEIIKVLKEEIHNSFNVKKRHNDFLFRVKCDAIFLSYLISKCRYPTFADFTFTDVYSTAALNWTLRF